MGGSIMLFTLVSKYVLVVEDGVSDGQGENDSLLILRLEITVVTVDSSIRFLRMRQSHC